MPTRILLTAIALTMLSPSVWAQLVSVRCCTEQADLEWIGECISGPGGTSQPASCPPAATCVLGFAENVLLMGALCYGEQEVPAVSFRAYCSEWAEEGSTVVQECVAKPHFSATMFGVYDDDQDGDLDLQDLAVFHQVYDSVPKLEQSEAVLASLKCCLPESAVRAIGECLSGPGVTTVPGACDGRAICVAGFTEYVEVGDWQSKLCTSGPAILPDPSTSYCHAWQAEDLPVTHFCPGAPIAGNSFFVAFDSDGDADVDLGDYAVFQREFGLPK